MKTQFTEQMCLCMKNDDGERTLGYKRFNWLYCFPINQEAELDFLMLPPSKCWDFTFKQHFSDHIIQQLLFTHNLKIFYELPFEVYISNR